MIKDTRPYRILVVEDNPGDLLIVEELLLETIAEPAILRASSYGSAIKILASDGQGIDIILLDLTLPDKGGMQLVTDMLQEAGDCPVIMLTGYSDLNFSIGSITQGISDYLIKDNLDSNSLYKSIIYSIERKKVLTDLSDSEKRFSDLFQLSPLPKWVYDRASGSIVQVNHAAYRHYGYTETEFLCLSMNDLLQELPDHPDPSLNPQEKTVKHRKKNGEIVDVEIYQFGLIISGRRCVSVLAIDVSEKLNFELLLTEAIIKAQEDERYEIGSELHDNVCQILATSNLRLGMMREALPEAILPMIKQCMNEIKMATKEIRRLSHQLAPAFHDFRTLEEEFSLLLDTINIDRKYSTSLTFDCEFNNRHISQELKLNLYRILQEHLANILEHAGGSTLSVDVIVRRDHVVLSVTDDGVGFDVKAVRHGIGLANMKRRVILFSGTLEIVTSPGNGCTIIAEIPLEARDVFTTIPA